MKPIIKDNKIGEGKITEIEVKREGGMMIEEEIGVEIEIINIDLEIEEVIGDLGIGLVQIQGQDQDLGIGHGVEIEIEIMGIEIREDPLQIVLIAEKVIIKLGNVTS